ncbi:fibrinogen alpha chain-like [Pyxicephalus adspersus]|uniref:fibrinogen alpha chain-like n=1 Tax=Pyxicephalus adspersus TaxID=30357 RepID=UPI003B5A69FC
METAKQTWVKSNSRHIITFSEIKHLHEATERDMLKDQDALKTFANIGNELRRRLIPLKQKVKEQEIKIERLVGELQDQLTEMKRLEVDVDIKVRSCKGSCRDVHLNILNLDNYETWNNHLNTVKNVHLAEDKYTRYINMTLANVNVTSFHNLFPLMQGKGLSLFEHIDQYMLKLEGEDKESENAE